MKLQKKIQKAKQQKERITTKQKQNKKKILIMKIKIL